MTSLSRVDLNLLVVFDSIFTEGGITKAAGRLNLTQPAISHALGRLREIFDDPLFHRQGHKMMPTPLARAVIEPIRQALQTIGGVIGDCGAFNPAEAVRRFKIGLRDAMEPVVLPSLMRKLAQDAPGIDVLSVRVDRNDVERDLAAGSYDVIADILMPVSPQIHHTLIASENLVVVARRDHPSVGPGLSLETYLDQEHVLATTSHLALGLADREVARFGRHRKIRLVCQQTYAACRVVSDSDLILTMPARYASVANLGFDNQLVPAPFADPTQQNYLYWHSNADLDPGNIWLRSQLLAVFEETQA